jgi:hypothetical protein
MAITESDFTNGPINDLGVSVTYTPVTVVENNITGEKETTDGTSSTITVVFENTNQKYSLDKAGLTEGANARMFCDKDQSISRNDKITHQSNTYRVETVSTRRFGSNAIFKTVLLYLV